jgi:hypothetical protein
MVPVTTKPYLNSSNLIFLQQGIPAFFLLIKVKINKQITFCKKTTDLRYVNNSDTSFYRIFRLTNISALRLKYLSLITKGGFLYGESSGI